MRRQAVWLIRSAGSRRTWALCGSQLGNWKAGHEHHELRTKLAEPVHDAAGHEEDDEDEDDAVQDSRLRSFELAEDRPVDLERPIRQPFDQQPADRRTHDRGDTPDDETGDELDRALQPERVGPDRRRRQREAADPPIAVTSALVANASTLYCAG